MRERGRQWSAQSRQPVLTSTGLVHPSDADVATLATEGGDALASAGDVADVEPEDAVGRGRGAEPQSEGGGGAGGPQPPRTPIVVLAGQVLELREEVLDRLLLKLVGAFVLLGGREWGWAAPQQAGGEMGEKGRKVGGKQGK